MGRDDSHTRIEKALQLIITASEGDLQRHPVLIKLLARRMKLNDTEVIKSNETQNDSDSTRVALTLSEPACPSGRPGQFLLELLTLCHKPLSHLIDPLAAIAGSNEPLARDRREQLLQNVEELSPNSLTRKHQYIRILCSRSLAIDYEAWIKGKGPSSLRQNRLPSFMRSTKMFSSTSRLHTSIQYGLKLRSQEEKLNSGISALSCLTKAFIKMTKEDLDAATTSLIAPSFQLVKERAAALCPLIETYQASFSTLPGSSPHAPNVPSHDVVKSSEHFSSLSSTSTLLVSKHVDIPKTCMVPADAPLQPSSPLQQAPDLARVSLQPKRLLTEGDTLSRKRQKPEEEAERVLFVPIIVSKPTSSFPSIASQHTEERLITSTSPETSFIHPRVDVYSPAEQLFSSSRAYFEYCCRTAFFNHEEVLLSPDGRELSYEKCNKFDSYCFTLTMNGGRPQIVCRLLAKAQALVPDIVQAQHPRSLACFLEVFIHLIRNGYSEVVSKLVESIRRESVGRNTSCEYLSHVFQLLGRIDPESMEDVLIKVWQCNVDIFGSNLGPFHRLTISIYMDYLKRIYGIAEPRVEGQRLREIWAGMKGTLNHSTPRVLLNLAHCMNRQGFHDKANELARQVYASLEKHEIFARRFVERIECLKIVSYCHFYEGDMGKAESMIQEAIRLMSKEWGQQHPWILEFMHVLLGWLRIWDRTKDAVNLGGQIAELMGKD